MIKKLLFNVFLLVCACTIQAQEIFTGVAYDSIYRYEYDSTKNWKPSYKVVELVYNSHLNPLGLTGKAPQNGSWVNYSKKTFTYDTNNNLTLDLWQSAYLNDWLNGSQTLYTYTSSNKVETAIYQTWNHLANSWENKKKTVYSYNTTGKESTKEESNWSSNNWQFSTRYTTAYNPDETIQTISRAYYSEFNSSWEENELQTFTYDANKNLTTYIVQTSGTNSNKMTYIYNNKNKEIQQNHFTWNGNAWVEMQRSFKTWDVNDHLTYHKLESYVNGKYITAATTENTYNTAQQLTDVVTYIYDVYKGNGTEIKSGVKIHYYISDKLNGIDKTELSDKIRIYPNPSNGTFVIDAENNYQIQNIEIYNAVGELIFQQRESNRVSIPNMQEGMYVVKIDNGSGVYTKKIIVQ
jgi:hypothetical protein